MDITKLTLQIELSQKELENGQKEAEIIRMRQLLYDLQNVPAPVVPTVVPAPVVPTVSTPVSDPVSDNVAAAGRRAVAESRNNDTARRRSTVSTPVKNNCAALSKAITKKLQKNPDQLISKILLHFKTTDRLTKEQFEPLKIKNDPTLKPFTTKWISGNHGLLSSLTRNAERPWMKKEQLLFGSIINPCLDPKLATTIWLSLKWREAIDKS